VFAPQHSTDAVEHLRRAIDLSERSREYSKVDSAQSPLGGQQRPGRPRGPADLGGASEGEACASPSGRIAGPPAFYCCFFDETHLPKADASLPPYLAVKAARSAARSALQALAAFIVAASCWAFAVFAFDETHLP
jgi:hypothetical protein